MSLTLEQLNLRQGVLRVFGKGSKERLVPLGEEAIDWMRNYLAEARPAILNGQQMAAAGTTVHVHFHSVTPPTEAEGQRLARQLVPHIRREMARAGA